jgi:hypothetical protein
MSDPRLQRAEFRGSRECGRGNCDDDDCKLERYDKEPAEDGRIFFVVRG